MQISNNLSIGKMLSIAFAVMQVLLIGLALFSYRQLGIVQSESRAISQDSLPSIRLAGQLYGDLLNYRVGMLTVISAVTPEVAAAGDNTITQARAAFKRDGDDYVKVLEAGEETLLFKELQAGFQDYDAVSQLGRSYIKEGRMDELRQLQVTKARAAAKAVFDASAKLTEYSNRQAGVSAEIAESTYRSGSLGLLAVCVLACVVSVVIAFLLIRAITTPLNRAVQAADKVAAGDLSERILVSGKNETARLLEAMERMRGSLGATVSAVRAGSESVASASSEIAQGNSDLSARTEAQASSLEETSATMEELSSTVRQNAENARQANQLAQSASEIARSGGRVVGDVVDNMRGIGESSRRIADIIATIDGIAFQTNILALNAAVEAARAGEQGRGFAVVAGEVRALAQRSAAAAKEIKGLIGESVQRVEAGSQLVERAGRTMTDIVDSVRRVADIVGEISSASAEQSLGIGQVGEAVSQLDRSTQQNAALVEQSAAASESLKVQAKRLLESVEAFRLT